MYYQCIENGQLTSALTYEPNVPKSVTVVEITEEEHDLIYNKETHTIDLTTLKVVPRPDAELQEKLRLEQISKTNKESLKYLQSTDWMVMRHIREKALGQTTSLTEEEYLALEQKRAQAAAAIVK